MFSSIGDLPLHPLVLHAAVLGLPVTLLLAILFAAPRTRAWARWPLAVAGVGSLVAVFVARASGAALMQVLLENEALGGDALALVVRHSQLADQLFWITLVLVVAALAAFWVYRVGDLGATAVWNPSGTQTYSSNGR